MYILNLINDSYQSLDQFHVENKQNNKELIF